MEQEAGKEKVSPKHVFLHLFVIIMLYYSTVNLLILLFQYINFLFPDLLSQINYSQMMFSSDLIRFAMASIIIVFPVFILTSRYLAKIYVRTPAIKEMRVRKWLIYFTLFVAALIMVGDLVRIILTFLEGEITIRFILKALSVLLVAAIIFFYYLRDLKLEKPQRSTKYIVWAIIIIILAAVVSGFFIIGSPKTERLHRFDYQRLSDLQSIQSQIVYNWQSKERLPVSLASLTDEISGFGVPLDPETKEQYEYRIISTTTFELCATFNLPSDENISRETAPMANPYSKSGFDNWKHEAGRQCFERTIDVELYQPFNKMKK